MQPAPLQTAICKRCLPQGTAEMIAEYCKNITAYRETLSAGQGVHDNVYNKRLAVCSNCDELSNGVCCQCGCFVHMRAAQRSKDCPNPMGDLWS